MPTKRARGLDISSVQGSVDFRAIAAAGFSYVVLKATEGATGRDPTYTARCVAARAAGLLVGAYAFMTTQTPIEDQARNFLDYIAGARPDFAAVDFESPPPEQWTDAINGEWLAERCSDFVVLLKSAGQRVIVYTYPYFANSLPYCEALLEVVNTPLWIASYVDEKHEPSDGDAPTVPTPWADWLFWQWSGSQGLPAAGVPSVVDHDVFNGTIENLRAWVAGDDAAPTSPGGVS